MNGRRLLSSAVGLCLLLPAGAVQAAEVNAEQLVQTGRRVAAGAQTLQADVVVVMRNGDNTTGTLMVMRPNYFRLRLRGPAGVTEICSDGKYVFSTIPAVGSYLRWPMESGASGAQFLEALCPPAAAFLAPDGLAKLGAHRSAGPIGVATSVGHEQYSGIELLGESSPVRTWYFNEAGFPAGAVFREGEPASVWVQNIRLGTNVQARDFLFELPLGQKSWLPGGSEEGLRPVGSALPDFSLPQAGGFRITLSGLRKAHKAVLVYVGAWDEAECREDLPKLRKLNEQLQEQQVGVVAVLEAGSADSLQSAARSAEIRFPLLHDETGAVGRAARLTETRSPATYLIDAAGRILWAGKRPDATKINEALRAQTVP